MFYHITVKKIRKEKKIKVNTICRTCNINPSTYWRWEKGEVTPTHNDIRILAQILDVPVQKISSLKEFKNKPFSDNNLSKLDDILNRYNISKNDADYFKEMNSLHNAIIKENDFLQDQLNNYQNAFLKAPSLLYLKMRTSKGFILILATDRFHQHFSIPKENINYFFNSTLSIEAKLKILETENKAVSNIIAVNNIRIKDHLYGLRVRTFKHDGTDYLVGQFVDKSDSEIIEDANYKIKIMELALHEIPDTFYFSLDIEKQGFIFISKGVNSVLGINQSELIKHPKVWCKNIHKEDYKRMLNYVDQSNHQHATIFKYNNPERGLRTIKTHFNSRFIDAKDILFGYFADITDYM